jgi:hypothetical protein
LRVEANRISRRSVLEMARGAQPQGFDELLIVNPSSSCFGAFCVEPVSRRVRMRRVPRRARSAGMASVLRGVGRARSRWRGPAPRSHPPPGTLFLGSDGVLYELM